ncbi:MAG: GNAT family N-acetyltransferase [Caldilineaceae bacterium]|nr:GNAT family N-acetyltransferase [Caldilineaceae bacterium]
MTTLERTLVRPFQANDLAPLVAFWNNAFADKRNFYPITAADFQSRILDCAAFDPNGLILAWHDQPGAPSQLVGMVHAFRPPPQSGLYAKWEQQHQLALLYVDPVHRRQGTGTRLLRAAENWLYYCPVHAGGSAQPCYGTVEGPRPPFFGASQRLGISVHDRSLINFLAFRGYRIVDAGDVSMQLELAPRPAPPLPDLAALGLELVSISHEMPFQGREPRGREEYALWGDNSGEPYAGYVLVTGDHLLQAHISWYPMRQAGRAAIAGFWVAPALRGHGLGRYLLDRTLYDLVHAPPPWRGYDTVPYRGESKTIPHKGAFQTVEVQTHVIHHPEAAALYERRGFVVEMAWVNMVKECTVRGAKPVGLSAY